MKLLLEYTFLSTSVRKFWKKPLVVSIAHRERKRNKKRAYHGVKYFTRRCAQQSPPLGIVGAAEPWTTDTIMDNINGCDTIAYVAAFSPYASTVAWIASPLLPSLPV